MKKIKLVFLCLAVINFCLGSVVFSQEETNQNSAVNEILVYLKEGKTLTDIQDLNQKYRVVSTQQPFQPFLKSIKQEEQKQTEAPKEAPADEHDRWYWQMDKSSQEYDKYQNKIAKKETEKNQQIQTIVETKETTSSVTTGVNIFENIYTLKVPEGTNIEQMLLDYNTHPAVQKAIPNTAKKSQTPTES